MCRISNNNEKIKAFSNFSDSLFKTLIFLCPLRILGFYEFPGGFLLTPYKFVLAVFIIVQVTLIIFSKIQIPNTVEFALLIYNLLYLFLTLIFSDSYKNSYFLTYLLGYTSLVFFVIYLFNSNNTYDSYYKWVTLSSIIPVIFGIVQYVNYQLFKRIIEFPFSEIFPFKNRSLILYGQIRIESTLGDPTYYGMYLILVIGCTLKVLNTYKTKGVKHHKNFVFFCYWWLLVSVFSLLITMSISSLVGGIFSIVIYLLLTHNPLKRIKLRGFVIFVLLMIAFFYIGERSSLFENMYIKYSNQRKSAGMFGREEYFSNALALWARQPFLGTGLGGLKSSFDEASTAHNTFLSILAQQGIFGIIPHILLLAIIPLLKYWTRKVNQNNFKTMYAIISGMIVTSFAYDIIYKVDYTYISISLLIGLSQSKSKESTIEGRR